MTNKILINSKVKLALSKQFLGLILTFRVHYRYFFEALILLPSFLFYRNKSQLKIDVFF